MKADKEGGHSRSAALDHTEYLVALQRYLAGDGEPALQQAYDIGRTALAAGVGLLALARIHHASLNTLALEQSSPEECARTLHPAAEFFAECISPYEMTYRGFHEANTALRHFNDVLEAEAKRIAHALHAEAGQLLVAVHIALRELTEQVPPHARDRISKVTQLLDQIEDQVRRLSHELRPAILEDLGLLPALQYLSEGLSQRARLKIAIECPPDERLPPSIESALYRIAQESLNNIAKHSRATRAWISIKRDAHQFRCTIRDNGVGFDVRAVRDRAGEQGFGLIGIRERLSVIGGTLQIESTIGQGTELVISVPAES